MRTAAAGGAVAKKMRVVVNAIPMTLVSTGISRYQRCLYAAMERLCAGEMEFAYFDGRALSPLPPQPVLGKTGFSLIGELFWRLPPRLALAARRALFLRAERRFLQCSRGFDIYHEASYFPFKAAAGVRTVFSVMDMSITRHPECHPRERVLFFERERAARFALAGRFIAISGFTKSELCDLAGIDPGLVDITPLACDPAVFHPRPQEQVSACLDRLGLPGRYFLFVGSGDPRKNMAVIPQALKAAGLDIPLVAAGWKGWLGDSPNCLALDFVSDDQLACLYSGALALVFPSVYEGFGLPLVEAMRCGCPVVSSPAASLPEVAGDAGAYMDRPDDVSGLGRILSRLAGDADWRGELRQKGLARAAEFSWEKTAGLTALTFHKVLGG